MKELTNKWTIALFTAITIIGCAERESDKGNITTKNLPSFADYYKLVSRKTDGKVVIQSTIGLASQNEVRNNYLDGHFDLGDSKIGRTDVPNVTVSGIDVNQKNSGRKSSQNIESLFGKVAKIEIGETLKTGRTGSAAGDIYIPQLLTIQGSVESLRDGDQIIWNADPKNTNGVTFKLEYKSHSQSNGSISKENVDNILNAFIVDDNGKLIISKEMISKFPNGSDVNLTIARGNMDFISNNENNLTYSVGGVTAVYTRTKIQK